MVKIYSFLATALSVTPVLSLALPVSRNVYRELTEAENQLKAREFEFTRRDIGSAILSYLEARNPASSNGNGNGEGPSTYYHHGGSTGPSSYSSSPIASVVSSPVTWDHVPLGAHRRVPADAGGGRSAHSSPPFSNAYQEYDANGVSVSSFNSKPSPPHSGDYSIPKSSHGGSARPSSSNSRVGTSKSSHYSTTSGGSHGSTQSSQKGAGAGTSNATTKPIDIPSKRK